MISLFLQDVKLKPKESVSEPKYHNYVASTTALIARWRLQDTYKCRRAQMQKRTQSEGKDHK
jgi:hypothetical protein